MDFKTLLDNAQNRRSLLKGMGVAAVGLTFTGALAGCGEKEAKKLANGEEAKLNFYNWDTYIGETTLEDFKGVSGVDVNMTLFASNDELFAKLKAGNQGYDVIVPSEYMVGKMIAENMLAELDYDNIPNMANIGENYLGWSYDPDNTYSVPYTWGTTGIIYNTTMVEEPPTSWADLWDVEYAGNVLMFNNSRDAYAIAAKKMGFSLNPSSVEEVDDVMKDLQAQKSVEQA